MNTPTDTKTVKSELAQLDPKRIELLRRFYYQISDALPQLAEELEFADIDTGTDDAGPLIDQHMIVCEMMESFKQLELGKLL